MSTEIMERSDILIEKKTIPVSIKRQITIPQKFYKALDLDSEVECTFNGQEIIIRPLKKETGYFAQEILNELIDKGLSGDEFKKEFAILNKSVRPAIKKLIEDAKEYADKNIKNYDDKTNELFDLED
jgi:bifunctional DNA-binding transcriptional regulator/antitoxin component of YhaV-PrlF toxin-antitoxin module